MTHASDADWPEIIDLDARAFALPSPLPRDEITEFRAKVPDEATYLIRDAGTVPGSSTIVGFSLYYDLPLTLPGGAVASAAGLSWVSVSATHRRRGLLRRMIDAQFADWRARGHPLAILTATEGTIYERFGFGPAAYAHRVHVSPSAASFRTAAPDDSRVRYGTPEEVEEHVPAVHARWAAARTGAIGRPEAWWPSLLADRSFRRNSQTSGLHYLLHPDGYAAYRIDARDRTALIDDLVAVTPQAHDDLWRVLTSLDLISSVHASIPVDDPLPHLLTDARAASFQARPDTLWLSILDVVDALQLRRYSEDGTIVLDVADDYSDRGGRYKLAVVDGRATVSRTDAAPNVSMDISVLSSLYLGGAPARGFSEAGRIDVDSADSLTQLARMFDVEHTPFAGTFF
ncbi:GNAT family N-acetyltransferase [Gordonia sp. HY442]|uniref:GNAT family N-acetyltransferase n=1 Tax=Gordonia zhenghanii TaxID=2911516 RepID=UPI001F3B3D64|nr:GNAT family N-acetyltransferase [Gordonia zhenghanii]MCF8602618.1 GNAT family N-acetyltransferase [Gordonia zhenghanii]